MNPLLRLVVSAALVLAVSGCVTGSGGYQNPSTPYKGNAPWNIASSISAPASPA